MARDRGQGSSASAACRGRARDIQFGFAGRWIGIGMILQTVDQIFDRFQDAIQLKWRHHAAPHVCRRQLQALESDFVIVRGERALLEHQFGLVERFVRIAGQKCADKNSQRSVKVIDRRG